MNALVTLAVAAAAHLPILAPQNWWPVFSPDGSRVAFTQVSGRTMTLEVVDRATKRTVRIAANQGQLAPSWSSDGRLAFSLGGHIYTSDADGSNRETVTSAGHAYAPAWRPHSTDIAYLTTLGARNTDMWVSGTLWARNAIGNPAWSPDGTQLAFERDDGIYVATGPGAERRAASIANPRRPAWSPDGRTIAYFAANRIWLVAADGSSAPQAVVSVGRHVTSDPIWTPDGTAIVYETGGGLRLRTLNGHTSRLHTAVVAGASVSSIDGAIAFTGPHPGCGHTAILLDRAGRVSTLAGTCEVDGTPGNDVIEGTGLIVAGKGNDFIHARNGHRDTVDCGPGRDTVWADRGDTLHGCEIVHVR